MTHRILFTEEGSKSRILLAIDGFTKKSRKAAYVQLLGYKDDLGNPPLLVVSDVKRITTIHSLDI